jgi:hypothetical protein
MYLSELLNLIETRVKAKRNRYVPFAYCNAFPAVRLALAPGTTWANMQIIG